MSEAFNPVIIDWQPTGHMWPTEWPLMKMHIVNIYLYICSITDWQNALKEILY